MGLMSFTGMPALLPPPGPEPRRGPDSSLAAWWRERQRFARDMTAEGRRATWVAGAMAAVLLLGTAAVLVVYA